MVLVVAISEATGGSPDGSLSGIRRHGRMLKTIFSKTIGQLLGGAAVLIGATLA